MPNTLKYHKSPFFALFAASLSLRLTGMCSCSSCCSTRRSSHWRSSDRCRLCRTTALTLLTRFTTGFAHSLDCVLSSLLFLFLFLPCLFHCCWLSEPTTRLVSTFHWARFCATTLSRSRSPTLHRLPPRRCRSLSSTTGSVIFFPLKCLYLSPHMK